MPGLACARDLNFNNYNFLFFFEEIIVFCLFSYRGISLEYRLPYEIREVKRVADEGHPTEKVRQAENAEAKEIQILIFFYKKQIICGEIVFT